MTSGEAHEQSIDRIGHGEISVKKPKSKAISNFFKRRLTKLALAGAALTIAASGIGYTIHENNENQQRIETSSSFDPSATNSYINPNNSVQMTLDEYTKDWPQVWKEESKTLTYPLPILFKDSRIPTLHIKKGKDMFGAYGINDYLIDDGLQEGDIILSPFDGIIKIYAPQREQTTSIRNFFIYYPSIDPPKSDGFSLISTPLEPLIDLEQATRENETYITMSIKRNQPIGKVMTSDQGKSFNPQIQFIGLSHSMEQNFNLATTSEGKVILLK